MARPETLSEASAHHSIVALASCLLVNTFEALPDNCTQCTHMIFKQSSPCTTVQRTRAPELYAKVPTGHNTLASVI
jgi:hypothetical protein